MFSRYMREGKEKRMEENEIKIRYNHSSYAAEPNRHLVNSLDEAMVKLGYKFYLSGYDYITKERTMIFRKEKGI